MNELQRTFAAVVEAKNWMPEANCRNMDVDLFFSGTGGNYTSFVKEVCADCPVQEECLWYANETSSDDGYFGGMTPRERMRWRRNNNVVLGQTKKEWDNRNRGYLRNPVSRWDEL